MNIEASIKTLVETLNSKFASEGAPLTVKVRKCRGYAKLDTVAGTIVFIDKATGVMHRCGNVTVEADRAALITTLFRGR